MIVLRSRVDRQTPLWLSISIVIIPGNWGTQPEINLKQGRLRGLRCRIHAFDCSYCSTGCAVRLVQMHTIMIVVEQRWPDVHLLKQQKGSEARPSCIALAVFGRRLGWPGNCLSRGRSHDSRSYGISAGLRPVICTYIFILSPYQITILKRLYAKRWIGLDWRNGSILLVYGERS